MPTPPFPPVNAGDIESELKDRLPELFGAGLVSSEVQKAFGHQTFQLRAADGRAYLLKIARQPAEVARLETIAQSVTLARGGGVRTPDIPMVAPAAARLGNRPYLLQEYWPGRDAEDAWPGLSQAARDAIVADWGREIARMHSIEAAGFTEGTVRSGEEANWEAHVENRLSRLLTYNRKAQVLEARELDGAQGKIRHLLARSAGQVRPALTHRDLCLRNVLLTPTDGFGGLLDFEHARMSDPMMDFVKLRLWLFEKDAAAERAFLAGYRAERGSEWPQEGERYELALLLELLGEIPYFKRNSLEAELGRAAERLRSLLSSR